MNTEEKIKEAITKYFFGSQYTTDGAVKDIQEIILAEKIKLLEELIVESSDKNLNKAIYNLISQLREEGKEKDKV